MYYTIGASVSSAPYIESTDSLTVQTVYIHACVIQCSKLPPLHGV